MKPPACNSAGNWKFRMSPSIRMRATSVGPTLNILEISEQACCGDLARAMADSTAAYGARAGATADPAGMAMLLLSSFTMLTGRGRRNKLRKVCNCRLMIVGQLRSHPIALADYGCARFTKPRTFQPRDEPWRRLVGS